MFAVHLPALAYLGGALVFLHAAVDVLHVSAVLSLGGLVLGTHYVLLLVFEVAFYFVIHFADLPQLVVLSHTILAHHIFCLLLSLLQLPLHSNFLAHSCLHNLFRHSCIDGHQSFLLSLELFLGNWWFFEIVHLLILSKPLGELVVVLKAIPAVRRVDDFVSGSVSEHLLGDRQSFGQLINVVVIHFFAFDYLDLSANIFSFLDVLFELLVLLLLVLFHLLSSLLHVRHWLGNHVGIIIR